MTWVSDFTQDPYKDKFVVGMYGAPGIGKTTAILDLALGGQVVILISCDGGTGRVRVNPGAYKGRLNVCYVSPDPGVAPGDLAFSFKKELEEAVREVVNVKVPGLIQKGVAASRIWVAIDTVTHVQQRLLNEVREMAIENPDYKDNWSKKTTRFDRKVLEQLTELDYNINGSMMTAISEFWNRLPCNLVLTMMVKQDDKTKRVQPAIQGASYQKLVGDCDVLLHIGTGQEGRVAHTAASGKWEAKDRFSVLEGSESFEQMSSGADAPALLKIRNKIFGTMVAPIAQEVK